MMKAIIETGGKQYLVNEGSEIFVEKLEAKSLSKSDRIKKYQFLRQRLFETNVSEDRDFQRAFNASLPNLSLVLTVR